MVAAQRAVALVKDAPGTAMGAGAFPVAFAAMQHRRITAPVQKQQALFAPIQPLAQGLQPGELRLSAS